MNNNELTNKLLDLIGRRFPSVPHSDDKAWSMLLAFAHEVYAMGSDRLAQPKQNDEKGRPMTYWGGLASDQPAQSKPEPRKLSHTEIGQLWSEHQKVYAFAKAIESKLTGRAS